MAYRSADHNTSATTSVAVNKPSGVVRGDILICFVTAYRGVSTTPGSIASSSSYFTMTNVAVGTYRRTATGYRIATSADEGYSSYTFTSTNATAMRGHILAFSGRKAAAPTPLSNTTYGTNDTIIRAAGITATANADLAVDWFRYMTSSNAVTKHASFTTVYDETTSTSYQTGFHSAYWNNVSSGATGDIDGTLATAVTTVKHAFMWNIPIQIQPTISSLSVNTGPTAGGTAVTITGTGFYGATNVTFGGTSVSSFTIVDDTSITTTTPAHTAGSNLQTIVVGCNGSSSDTANDDFTFADVSAVSLDPLGMSGFFGV